MFINIRLNRLNVFFAILYTLLYDFLSSDYFCLPEIQAMDLFSFRDFVIMTVVKLLSELRP